VHVVHALYGAIVDGDDEVAAVQTRGKQLKPYMDFLGGPPRTIYRNWDPIAGNYALGGPTARLDRGAEVLRGPGRVDAGIGQPRATGSDTGVLPAA